jgi:hypothetical protein
MIALKREVAALVAGYSVERMSSYETGDKSLYQGSSASGREHVRNSADLVTVAKQFCLAVFTGWQETHGSVYSNRLSH